MKSMRIILYGIYRGVISPARYREAFVAIAFWNWEVQHLRVLTDLFYQWCKSEKAIGFTTTIVVEQ